MQNGLRESGACTDARLRTFETLDILRGVAAAIVVCFHFASLYGKTGWVRHGYLAVDLFFTLSGFVLAYRYQFKLDTGFSTPAFLKARLIRLYPLYLVGLVLGVVFAFLHFRGLAGAPSPLVRGATLLLSLLFLPTIITSPHTEMFWLEAFPFNSPSWSLFSELLANAGHGLFLRRRSTTFLLVLACGAGAALGACILWRGTVNFGFQQKATLLGPIRITYSYLLGALVCRLWRHKPEMLRVPPAVPVGLLLLLLTVPAGSLSHRVFDLLATLVGLPCILLLAVYSQPAVRWRSVTSMMGTTSYATYAVHLPLLFLFHGAWPRLTHRTATANPYLAFSVYLILVLGLSLLLNRFYDVPVRSRLRALRLAPARRKATMLALPNAAAKFGT